MLELVGGCADDQLVALAIFQLVIVNKEQPKRTTQFRGTADEKLIVIVARDDAADFHFENACRIEADVFQRNAGRAVARREDVGEKHVSFKIAGSGNFVAKRKPIVAVGPFDRSVVFKRFVEDQRSGREKVPSLIILRLMFAPDLSLAPLTIVIALPERVRPLSKTSTPSSTIVALV